MNTGTVYLIGAGPYNPGLITVRGLALLKRADVVVYDRLAHPSLLQVVRTGAEQIYAGKSSGRHALPQEEINRILVERALQGLSVARLKGGDPFVFGRGGEEAEACVEAGVPYEVVPGVTSAVAAPAFAGIPVTHRDAASSFAVIIGHERADSSEPVPGQASPAENRRDWESIVNGADTLVFLMGVESLPDIVDRLKSHGRGLDTPVALIQWGATPRQKVCVSTVETIVQDAAGTGIGPPAVCIVGEVVRLRERLRWFDLPERFPLLGKRILVTRAREQASSLSDLLRQEAADPIEFPAIRIAPLNDYSKLDEALCNLSQYQWLIFTSARAVSSVCERMAVLKYDSRRMAATKVAAIGPATAHQLYTDLRIIADYVPTEALAEAVLEQWPEGSIARLHMLIPRAKEARDVLPLGLRKRGALVDVVPAYETLLDGSGAGELRCELDAGNVDVITFTSSSTVRNFVTSLVQSGMEDISDLIGNAVVAAIGPVTEATAQELGIRVHLTANDHTIPGLVAALVEYFRSSSSE